MIVKVSVVELQPILYVYMYGQGSSLSAHMIVFKL